jgi:hypothetical protein
MRSLTVVAIAALLAGCHHRKPSMSDAEFKALKASNPGMTQKCLDANRFGGVLAWRPDDPACFDMLPDQRWTGLWEKGWEWTNFCPDPAADCDWMAKRGIWLTFAKDAYRGPKLANGIYRIEFIGRRTRQAGNFGHTNAYDHLMVVDRLISIRQVEPPRTERPGP